MSAVTVQEIVEALLNPPGWLSAEELAARIKQHGIAPNWPTGILNRAKTLEVLKRHNEWRRGGDGPQTDPRMLGLALDAAIAYIEQHGITPPDGWVLVRKDLVEFLHGAEQFDGVWFGEKHPNHVGNYWWRKFLAAAPEVSNEP